MWPLDGLKEPVAIAVAVLCFYDRQLRYNHHVLKNRATFASHLEQTKQINEMATIYRKFNVLLSFPCLYNYSTIHDVNQLFCLYSNSEKAK